MLNSHTILATQEIDITLIIYICSLIFLLICQLELIDWLIDSLTDLLSGYLTDWWCMYLFVGEVDWTVENEDEGEEEEEEVNNLP